MTAPPAALPRPPDDRPAEQGEQFVIEFDARPDHGPRLVGPFHTRGQADAYARTLQKAVYCVCPISTP